MKTGLLIFAMAATCGARFTSAQLLADWRTIAIYQGNPGLASKGGKIAIRQDGVVFNVGWIWTDADGSYGAAVRTSPDGGQNWQTQSVYTTPGWKGTEYNGLAFDRAGCLVAAGETWDPNPNDHKNWVVPRSCDSGASFTLVDSYPEGNCPSAQDIALSANGDLYVTGFARGWNVPFMWAVRKSSDGGATWRTMNLEGTINVNAGFAIACQPNGNIFVSGEMSYLSRGLPIERWTVKRSVDQGLKWTAVDSFQEYRDYESAATASTIDQAGYVYVAGWAQNAAKKNARVTDWIVRRSTDNGTTWTIADRFTLSSGHPISPLAMTVDPKGNIWVCGYTEQNDGTVPMQWIVRKGTRAANGALAWAEVDNYQLAPEQHARANGITSDAAGNIYVSGRANDSSGSTFWIVRKLNAN